MFSALKDRYKSWEAYKNNLKQTNAVMYRIVDTVEVVTVALVMALIIRHFVLQTSVIPSPSMVPTLMVKDRLFVNKFIYRFTPVHRGDIVVFDSPLDDGKDYVKRCIGLPGETLEVKTGEVYINGKLLVLPGVNVQTDKSDFGPYTIPSDSYFMMGDNRGNSYDSRYWGALNERKLLGKAIFTFWPLYRMRPLH